MVKPDPWYSLRWRQRKKLLEGILDGTRESLDNIVEASEQEEHVRLREQQEAGGRAPCEGGKPGSRKRVRGLPVRRWGSLGAGSG